MSIADGGVGCWSPELFEYNEAHDPLGAMSDVLQSEGVRPLPMSAPASPKRGAAILGRVLREQLALRLRAAVASHDGLGKPEELSLSPEVKGRRSSTRGASRSPPDVIALPTSASAVAHGRTGSGVSSSSDDRRSYGVFASQDLSDAPITNWIKGSLIGSGAYGKVYLALNRQTGQIFATKTIEFYTTDGGTKRELACLQNEVELLRHLHSPHIVRYLGTERAPVPGNSGMETLHIFLEYMPGGSVYALMQKFGGKFDEGLVRVYTKHILQGLCFLHRHNIVHRDIKGCNVLVGSDGCVKLADFGASRKIAEIMASSGGNAMSMHGTPFWMAPEVIQQTGHGLEADIWSLGCTVIEMVAGSPPWAELPPFVAMFRIGMSEEMPEIPAELSEEGKDFLNCCLQRDPSKRSTAEQLLRHPFICTQMPLDERPARRAAASNQVPDGGNEPPVLDPKPLDHGKRRQKRQGQRAAPVATTASPMELPGTPREGDAEQGAAGAAAGAGGSPSLSPAVGPLQHPSLAMSAIGAAAGGVGASGQKDATLGGQKDGTLGGVSGGASDAGPGSTRSGTSSRRTPDEITRTPQVTAGDVQIPSPSFGGGLTPNGPLVSPPQQEDPVKPIASSVAPTPSINFSFGGSEDAAAAVTATTPGLPHEEEPDLWNFVEGSPLPPIPSPSSPMSKDTGRRSPGVMWRGDPTQSPPGAMPLGFAGPGYGGSNSRPLSMPETDKRGMMPDYMAGPSGLISRAPDVAGGPGQPILDVRLADADASIDMSLLPALSLRRALGQGPTAERAAALLTDGDDRSVQSAMPEGRIAYSDNSYSFMAGGSGSGGMVDDACYDPRFSFDADHGVDDSIPVSASPELKHSAATAGDTPAWLHLPGDSSTMPTLAMPALSSSGTTVPPFSNAADLSPLPFLSPEVLSLGAATVGSLDKRPWPHVPSPDGPWSLAADGNALEASLAAAGGHVWEAAAGMKAAAAVELGKGVGRDGSVDERAGDGGQLGGKVALFVEGLPDAAVPLAAEYGRKGEQAKEGPAKAPHLGTHAVPAQGAIPGRSPEGPGLRRETARAGGASPVLSGRPGEAGPPPLSHPGGGIVMPATATHLAPTPATPPASTPAAVAANRAEPASLSPQPVGGLRETGGAALLRGQSPQNSLRGEGEEGEEEKASSREDSTQGQGHGRDPGPVSVEPSWAQPATLPPQMMPPVLSRNPVRPPQAGGGGAQGPGLGGAGGGGNALMEEAGVGGPVGEGYDPAEVRVLVVAAGGGEGGASLDLQVRERRASDEGQRPRNEWDDSGDRGGDYGSVQEAPGGPSQRRASYQNSGDVFERDSGGSHRGGRLEGYGRGMGDPGGLGQRGYDSDHGQSTAGRSSGRPLSADTRTSRLGDGRPGEMGVAPDALSHAHPRPLHPTGGGAQQLWGGEVGAGASRAQGSPAWGGGSGHDRAAMDGGRDADGRAMSSRDSDRHASTHAHGQAGRGGPIPGASSGLFPGGVAPLQSGQSWPVARVTDSVEALWTHVRANSGPPDPSAAPAHTASHSRLAPPGHPFGHFSSSAGDVTVNLHESPGVAVVEDGMGGHSASAMNGRVVDGTGRGSPGDASAAYHSEDVRRGSAGGSAALAPRQHLPSGQPALSGREHPSAGSGVVPRGHGPPKHGIHVHERGGIMPAHEHGHTLYRDDSAHGGSTGRQHIIVPYDPARDSGAHGAASHPHQDSGSQVYNYAGVHAGNDTGIHGHAASTKLFMAREGHPSATSPAGDSASMSPAGSPRLSSADLGQEWADSASSCGTAKTYSSGSSVVAAADIHGSDGGGTGGASAGGGASRGPQLAPPYGGGSFNSPTSRVDHGGSATAEHGHVTHHHSSSAGGDPFALLHARRGGSAPGSGADLVALASTGVGSSHGPTRQMSAAAMGHERGGSTSTSSSSLASLASQSQHSKRIGLAQQRSPPEGETWSRTAASADPNGLPGSSLGSHREGGSGGVSGASDSSPSSSLQPGASTSGTMRVSSAAPAKPKGSSLRKEATSTAGPATKSDRMGVSRAGPAQGGAGALTAASTAAPAKVKSFRSGSGKTGDFASMGGDKDRESKDRDGPPVAHVSIIPVLLKGTAGARKAAGSAMSGAQALGHVTGGGSTSGGGSNNQKVFSVSPRSVALAAGSAVVAQLSEEASLRRKAQGQAHQQQQLQQLDGGSMHGGIGGSAGGSGDRDVVVRRNVTSPVPQATDFPRYESDVDTDSQGSGSGPQRLAPSLAWQDGIAGSASMTSEASSSPSSQPGHGQAVSASGVGTRVGGGKGTEGQARLLTDDGATLMLARGQSSATTGHASSGTNSVGSRLGPSRDGSGVGRPPLSVSPPNVFISLKSGLVVQGAPGAGSTGGGGTLAAAVGPWERDDSAHADGFIHGAIASISASQAGSASGRLSGGAELAARARANSAHEYTGGSSMTRSHSHGDALDMAGAAPGLLAQPEGTIGSDPHLWAAHGKAPGRSHLAPARGAAPSSHAQEGRYDGKQVVVVSTSHHASGNTIGGKDNVVLTTASSVGAHNVSTASGSVTLHGNAGVVAPGLVQSGGASSSSRELIRVVAVSPAVPTTASTVMEASLGGGAPGMASASTRGMSSSAGAGSKGDGTVTEASKYGGTSGARQTITRQPSGSSGVSEASRAAGEKKGLPSRRATFASTGLTLAASANAGGNASASGSVHSSSGNVAGLAIVSTVVQEPGSGGSVGSSGLSGRTLSGRSISSSSILKDRDEPGRKAVVKTHTTTVLSTVAIPVKKGS
eukprot:jgi/Mesvir1/17149/Mv07575-RA.1